MKNNKKMATTGATASSGTIPSPTRTPGRASAAALLRPGMFCKISLKYLQDIFLIVVFVYSLFFDIAFIPVTEPKLSCMRVLAAVS